MLPVHALPLCRSSRWRGDKYVCLFTVYVCLWGNEAQGLRLRTGSSACALVLAQWGGGGRVGVSPTAENARISTLPATGSIAALCSPQQQAGNGVVGTTAAHT